LGSKKRNNSTFLGEGRIMQGPISKQAWGRIWARAFHNSIFRGDLEKSPLDGATKFFGTVITPLFATEGTKAHHCVKKIYDDLEDLRDHPDPGKKAKPGKLASGIYGPSDPDLKPIIDSIHGNEWILMKKDLNNPGQFLWIHRDQHQLNATPAAGNALTQLEWARVYAEAVVDETIFQPLLKQDPAAAIHEMARRYANFQPHNLGTPLLMLRSSSHLFASIQANTTIPNTEEVKTQAGLDAVLQRLDLGIDDEYEMCLNVCLSC
jgi:hypothetical protein